MQAILANEQHPHQERIPALASTIHYLEEDESQKHVVAGIWSGKKDETLNKSRAALKTT